MIIAFFFLDFPLLRVLGFFFYYYNVNNTHAEFQYILNKDI